jgi:hypothetical protein
MSVTKGENESVSARARMIAGCRKGFGHNPQKSDKILSEFECTNGIDMRTDAHASRILCVIRRSYVKMAFFQLDLVQ